MNTYSHTSLYILKVRRKCLIDQDYLVLRAKNALKTDPVTAKAWMITAKTLYPTNFGVQVP